MGEDKCPRCNGELRDWVQPNEFQSCFVRCENCRWQTPLFQYDSSRTDNQTIAAWEYVRDYRYNFGAKRGGSDES